MTKGRLSFIKKLFGGNEIKSDLCPPFFANDLYQAGTLRQSDVLMKSMRRHYVVSA